MKGLRPGSGFAAAVPAYEATAGARRAAVAEGGRRHGPVRKYWLSVALAATCLSAGTYVASLFAAQNSVMAALEAEQAALSRQLEAARDRNQKLKQEILRLQTDEYIETVAREQLGYIRPGEIPYMALDKGSGKAR